MILRLVFITALYINFVLKIHFADGGWKQTFDLQNLAILGLSWAFLLLLFFAIEAIMHQRYARWMNALLGFIYVILSYYQRNTRHSIDFSVIANNWQATTHHDSFLQTLGLIRDIYIPENVILAFVVAGLIFWSYRWSPPKNLHVSRRFGVVAAFLFLGVLLTTRFTYSHDQYSRFVRTVFRHYSPLKTHLDEITTRLERLPSVEIASDYKGKKPNVIFVLVEALNSRFIDQKHTDGREYTPNLNKLVREAIYAPDYYANSVQTGKGHFVAFCGQVSNVSVIEFRVFEHQDFECLPSVLKQYGYSSYFFKAHSDANFDNEQVYLLKHDVEEADAIGKTCADETDACFGWGIRDDVFYRRAFARLNARQDKQPLFAMLPTITTHQPFMGVPEGERAFYPEQRSRREGYLNSLKFADDAFLVLMEEFKKSPLAKNSILIITGDHGYPLGEHGNSHNENYAYQESFRVPLLIFDYREGRTHRPAVLSGQFSHLNLPATILDMVGYTGKAPFVGESIFSEKAKGHPIYLVQPYSGGYIAIVQGKWKYIFESSRGQEYVYDLESDPEEKQNLRATLAPEILSSLQRAAAQVKKQQEIFIPR